MRVEAPFEVSVAEDRVAVAGQRYDAEFAPGVVRFTSPLSDGGADSARLELRFLGGRRMGFTLAADHVVAPTTDGDRVQFEHGDVVERYELGVTGISQSFVVQQRPGGSGDLVIDLAVAGNVAAPAQAPAHQAIEFACGNVPAIRYGEAFVLGRHGERLEIATAWDGTGRLELIVPAAVVESATYPMVIDPAIGAVFLVGGTGWDHQRPDVAFDAIQGLYLVVWERLFSSTTGIRGQIVDRDGGLVTPVFNIATGACSRPAVALNLGTSPDTFFVVWQQPDGIWGRLVAVANGALPAPAFPISTPSAGQLDTNPTVSGEGNNLAAMWVAWERSVGGSTVPTSIVTENVVWPYVVPGLPTVGAERIVTSVTSGRVELPKFAKSDAQILGTGSVIHRLVWQRFWTTPAPGDYDVETMSFSSTPAGGLYTVLQSPTIVQGASIVGTDQRAPSIAALAVEGITANHYLIAWEDDGDIKARRYDELGPVGSLITIADTPTLEARPAVAGGYHGFTVGYMFTVGPFHTDVYAARVRANGVVAAANKVVDGTGNFIKQEIAAASVPSISASQEESDRALFVWRDRTSAPTVSELRARFFEPVAVSEVPFGSACPGPGGQLASIGSADGPPYSGNSAYRITLSAAVPNSLAVLVASSSLASVPIPGAPGCTLYVGTPLIVVNASVTDAAGSTWSPLPIPGGLYSSMDLATQWAIYAPTANPFGWVVSNDLDIRWTP